MRPEGAAAHVAGAAGGLLARRREPRDRAAWRERLSGDDDGGLGGAPARAARLPRAAVPPWRGRPVDRRAALLGDLAGATGRVDPAVGPSLRELNLSLASQHLFCSNLFNG